MDRNCNGYFQQIEKGLFQIGITKRFDPYIIISELLLPPPTEIPKRLLRYISLRNSLFWSIISKCCAVIVKEKCNNNRHLNNIVFWENYILRKEQF